ncbi:unnamed protein product, partial [Meganyctiphanes norvegica]
PHKSMARIPENGGTRRSGRPRNGNSIYEGYELNEPITTKTKEETQKELEEASKIPLPEEESETEKKATSMAGVRKKIKKVKKTNTPVENTQINTTDEEDNIEKEKNRECQECRKPHRYGIVCELCDKWSCRGCSELNKTEIKVIQQEKENISNLHWNCKPCMKRIEDKVDERHVESECEEEKKGCAKCKTEKETFIQCDYCKNWLCRNCEKLLKKQIDHIVEITGKTTGLTWACNRCEHDGEQLNKLTIVEHENRIAEHNKENETPEMTDCQNTECQRKEQQWLQKEQQWLRHSEDQYRKIEDQDKKQKLLISTIQDLTIQQREEEIKELKEKVKELTGIKESKEGEDDR